MATQKKAWLSALATFVLVAVLGLSFAFKPFKNNKTVAAPLTYYFIGSSPSQANLPGQWSTTPPEGLECSEGTMPCQVTLETNVNPDITSFINGRSASAVVADDLVSTKPE